LSTIEEEFAAPAAETLKGGNLRQRVSRCQVCQRTPTCTGNGVATSSNESRGDFASFERNNASHFDDSSYGEYAYDGSF
jgi:hypothetical protein